MVEGLDKFRAHFGDVADRFALIGGVAVAHWFQKAQRPPRITRDFDMLLMIDQLDAELGGHIWEFVRQGRYSQRERSDGDREFFRFSQPQTDGYPLMLELFARRPETLHVPPDQTIIPIAPGDDVSSLSAILVSDAYDRLVRDTTQIDEGLPYVRPEGLIPLKACAWLDLTQRREDGQAVNGRDIRKHRNDAFKLTTLLKPGEAISVDASVRADLDRFLDAFPPGADDWAAIAASGSDIPLPEPATLIDTLRTNFVAA